MTFEQPVPPVRGWHRAAIPAAWSVALASLAVLDRNVPSGDWLLWAAALAALAAHWLAAGVLGSGLPAAFRHQLPLVLGLAGAPLFMLAAASGGSASPAALAAGPLVLGIGWRLGVSRAIASASAAVLLLLVADLAMHGTVHVPHLIAVALATTAV